MGASAQEDEPSWRSLWHFMPLDGALKMVNFILCILYHNLKKFKTNNVIIMY